MSYFSFNPRLALNLFLTSLILFSVNLHADSPVWKVSNKSQHLYIGGTVHLLGKKDYPLPSEFDLAYKQSSKLILETDISQMQTASVQQTLMTLAMYKEGETIQSRLSPHTYQELKAFCLSRRIDIQGLNQEVNISNSGMPFEASRINSFGDHRIAMTSAIACTRASEKSYIEDTKNVTTSFPNFLEICEEVGLDIK